MSIKIIRRQQPESNCQFAGDMHPVLKHIYTLRGITESKQLDYSLKQLLPFDALLGIDNAVQLLFEALQQQQRMLIIGDFDADGATSSALAVTALKAFGAKHVEYLVPNRFDFGYGLTPEIVDVAAKWQPDLIVTVDNGIANHAGVDRAKQLGFKVLITDHHLPADTLPNADAIVNPNQPQDTFASKNLAGVGVIFYIMLALRRYLREQQWFEKHAIAEPNMGQYLDLVALGTVADVVPLDHNNRILVQQGLQRIRAGKARPGILALLKVANRPLHRVVASDLGFAAGPRLNAAGRLDDMSIGIECLLCGDEARALAIATELNELNMERRNIETDMQQQAFALLNKINLDNKNFPRGVALFDSEWHQGVIGILASRIKDKLHRPVIAFADAGNGEIKGSARSVAGLHIRDALDNVATQNPGLILKFGGHAMAAGLSIKQKDFQAFQQAFDKEVSQHLSEQDLQGSIFSDGSLEVADFSLPLAQLLRNAGPWGQTFPEPIFDGEFQVLTQRLVGAKHLKMVLQLGQLQFDAIAFNIDPEKWPNHRIEKMHIAYKLDVNEFRGQQSLQLMVEHLVVS